MTWKKATGVAQRTEPRSFDIQMNTGETLRRNRIDFRKSPETNDREEQDVDKENHGQNVGEQLQHARRSEDYRDNHPDNQRVMLSNEHYVTCSGRISEKSTGVFFFFLLSLTEACFVTNESNANEFDRRSFVTLELKSRSCSCRRTAKAADGLGGVRVIDRDRQSRKGLGVNVVHNA